MEGEKAPGGESGEGEALVVPEWLGQWRRQELPETGKKTSPGRLRAREAPLRWPLCGNGLGAPLNRRVEAVQRRPRMSSSATDVL